MRVKTKIIVSNIVVVCIPILITLVFWTSYSLSTDFEESRPIKFKNIYSQYKKRFSDIDWTNMRAAFSNKKVVDGVSELYESGVRFKIYSGDEVLFTNLESNDEECFYTHIKSLDSVCECFISHDGRYVFFDAVEKNGVPYNIFVIYDSGAANPKLKKSFVPIYMIPSTSMAVFVTVLILSIILVEMAVTVWLGNSVLIPLNIFRKATGEIANGNLSRSVRYESGDEFHDVVADLDRMRLSLKDLERKQMGYEENRKSILLGISHDLRSPLTSIKGYACGLRDGIARTEEKKRYYYDAILLRTNDMESMVNRLYELLRFDIDITLMKFEHKSLNEFIERFFDGKRIFMEEHGAKLSLDFQDEIVMDFDEFEMGRVFINLLENSIKYRTRESSLISVSLCGNGGNAELVFKDDGPGVPDECLEKIFEIFYRIDQSRSASEKGNGLGLAIIKKVVEGHGGTIRAFNDCGLGFFITLPVMAGGIVDEKNFDC